MIKQQKMLFKKKKTWIMKNEEKIGNKRKNNKEWGWKIKQ